MKLVSISILLVCGGAAWCKGQLTPAFIIVGTWDGRIVRCQINNPETCDTIQKVRDAPVWTTLVHGIHLFAGLDSGEILQCNWNLKNSCVVYYQNNGSIITLAVSSGFLIAGGYDGAVLQCELDEPNSCTKIYTSQDPVRDIFPFRNRLFIATSKSLLQCSKDADLQCSEVTVHGQKSDELDLFSVTYLKNSIITIGHHDQIVRTYEMALMGYMIPENKVSMSSGTLNVKVFRRKIYVLASSDDIMVSDEGDNYTVFTRDLTTGSLSISFVYGVHQMSKQGLEGMCLEQTAIGNYDVKHRALLEVHVVDGLLEDARGGIVDTRNGDRGYSGHAAVFAMGPDGQLLLSKAHRSGLVHISSLFAGGPVAGAGEIVVENGVVKRIIACSQYYWANVELNRQVVDELYKRGYYGADEIQLKEYQYTYDRN